MATHTSYAVLHQASVGAVRLEPGDLVGRMRSAGMRLDHPHVSEAHAYLSLRDGALRLLALRGVLALDGQVVREVRLAPGQRIGLALALELDVVEVRNPERLLALAWPGRPPEVLAGGVVSLVPGIGPVGRIVPDAPVHLWTDGSGWVVAQGGRSRPLRAGDLLQIAGETVAVVDVPVGGADAETVPGGRLDEPLCIEGYYDAVHIHRQGRPSVVLAGAAGRLMAELGAIGQPVHWTEMGRALWPDDDDDPARLRKRWDLTLLRIRRRLARAAIRTDLVLPDGAGKVQLLLGPGDRWVDRG